MNAAGFVLPAALECLVSNSHKACQRFSFCRGGGPGYLEGLCRAPSALCPRLSRCAC
ncbi:hypothetical protein CBM2589_A90082 [Cupriavidus taiwanensis]|uniref:Uncharacterized protein n=1 Tax=Cupriavidus taiwanensis TaxID=164546 RepID=A0A375CEU6_9BURK|nr:hypothetical protein CBM2589_A90082 [Cupriavidus taiwanensis]